MTNEMIIYSILFALGILIVGKLVAHVPKKKEEHHEHHHKH